MQRRRRADGGMPSFHWTSHNQVYVPELDQEHQVIFRLAEDVSRAVRSGALLAAIQPKLRELIRRARLHFTHEEKRMVSLRYPGYEWHRRQHDTLRRKVAKLQQSVRQGDREAILPAMEYLAGWLRDHTSVSDRMMTAYLRNHSRPTR